jgi:PKD repeat protein
MICLSEKFVYKLFFLFLKKNPPFKMNKITHYLSIIAFLIYLTQPIYAQDNSNLECGTIVTPQSELFFENIKPQIEFHENEYYQMLQNRSSSAINSIPIKAHIIRTSSGAGGLTVTELNDAIANVNAFYANSFMEFFLCDGINYIDDDNLYNFETNDEAAMTATHNVGNLINIYFTDNVTSSSSGGGLCGYAYPPGGNDVILMANSCAINGSTLPHEIGHFFSLRHTHGPSNSELTTELVDGSNCDTDGDLICDTAADPQLSYSNVNLSCIYTGALIDANGDAFDPDPRNIMSYSRKECRDVFSTGQYARMYASYQTARNYFACPSFNVQVASDFTQSCDGDVAVNFTDNSVGAVSWEWDIDGDDVIDYTTQNPTHTYTTSGTYDIALTISNGTDTITKVFSEYINIGGLEINTTQVELTLTTDDWSDETSWDFKDSNGTILYSGGPYNGTTDDFSVFTEIFNVASDECYTFTIYDSYGDGICCGSGNGSYELRTFEGVLFASGGNFQNTDEVLISNDPLSVEDFSIDTFKVYPNPTTDVLNIKVVENNLPDTIEIYNMLGQIITSKSITSENDLNHDVSTLNNGVYFVKIKKKSQSISIPFVKK